MSGERGGGSGGSREGLYEEEIFRLRQKDKKQPAFKKPGQTIQAYNQYLLNESVCFSLVSFIFKRLSWFENKQSWCFLNPYEHTYVPWECARHMHAQCQISSEIIPGGTVKFSARVTALGGAW